MATIARRDLAARRRSMLPGGRRDFFVRWAKKLLPILSGALLVFLLALPLVKNREFSFLLSKGNAAHSTDRLQVQQAQYSGETTSGDPFTIRARSAVQRTSDVPVVVLGGLSARIVQQSGPATVTAPSGEYFLDQNRLVVDGPLIAQSQSGYSLNGQGIEVDIDKREVTTAKPVSGKLPMGSFEAGNFAADLDGKKIEMGGKVHFRIDPAGLKE